MMVIYARSRTTAENSKTVRHRQISTRSTEASASTASRSVVMANPNWPLIFASGVDMLLRANNAGPRFAPRS
jgi:hypothetical protein